VDCLAALTIRALSGIGGLQSTIERNARIRWSPVDFPPEGEGRIT
jgi:hypothetical protein